MRLLSLLLATHLAGASQQQQNATFESLLVTAQRAQASNDYQNAATAYKKAVRIRPDIPELWANLGLMEHESRDYSEAIQSFEHAHRLNPSLYVPNLFLGIDLVQTNHPKAAIRYLLTAEKLNSSDIEPHLILGKAYSSLQEFKLAAHEFGLVTQSDPNRSSAWFSLGIALLDQVESDARKMSEEAPDSPYSKALFAEALTSQSRYLEAVDLYKNVLASPSQPPCMHAVLGFVYLKQRDTAKAASEFEAAQSATPRCPLAGIGQARLRLEADDPDGSLKLLSQEWERNPEFVEINSLFFIDGMSQEHLSGFSAFLVRQHESNQIPKGLFEVFVSALKGESSHPHISSEQIVSAQSANDPDDDYMRGRYRQCADHTMSSLDTKAPNKLRLLTVCSFLIGDYALSSRAGAELTEILPQSVEVIYWSIRANEKLAFQALEQYEHLEPASERTHLLLGDIYVQRERYDDALDEYQKASNLAPGDPAALLGLASAYFRNANIPKTIENAQLALGKAPEDPEINLLMGEAWMARHDFASAEPFLKKGLQAKPQMLPHVHALLGRVFAETGRDQEAIKELKLGVSSDEDGSVHYQLARLYRKSGNAKDATVALEEMREIQERRRANAVIAFKDSHPTTLDDEP